MAIDDLRQTRFVQADLVGDGALGAADFEDREPEGSQRLGGGRAGHLGKKYPDPDTACQVFSKLGQIWSIPDGVLADDFTEMARRIRAAMAYGDVSRERAAVVMKVSTGDLSRLYGKKGKETKSATVQQLWDLADEAGLPAEFFSADLTRLVDIVAPGEPVRSTPRDPGEIAAEAARLLEDTRTPSPARGKRGAGKGRAA